MQTVQYSNSSAGAGKTRSLVGKAFRLEADERSVLLVQPTTDLIDQTVINTLRTMIRQNKVHIAL